LDVSWVGSLYIHFWGLLPPNGILAGANSLCVQVLHSPIFAALLHGTRVVGVSHTLWHSAEGATYIQQGGQSHWASAHILVWNMLNCFCWFETVGLYEADLLQVKDNETSTMETVQGIQQTIALLQKVSMLCVYSSVEMSLEMSVNFMPADAVVGGLDWIPNEKCELLAASEMSFSQNLSAAAE